MGIALGMKVEGVVLEADFGGVAVVALVALVGFLRHVQSGNVSVNVGKGIAAVLTHCFTRLAVEVDKNLGMNNTDLTISRPSINII